MCGILDNIGGRERETEIKRKVKRGRYLLYDSWNGEGNKEEIKREKKDKRKKERYRRETFVRKERKT